MAVEFTFTITPESFTVTILGTDFSSTVENQPVDLAKRPGELAVSLPLFSGDREDIAPEVLMMQRLTVLLHRELQKQMPFKHLVAKLFDWFDYFLTIESDISPELVQQLADALPVYLRLRRLTINGQDLTIPLWRRNVEYWLRRFLVDVMPLAALIFGYFLMPAYFGSNPWLFLIYLCAVPCLFFFIGKGIWVFFSQKLVPRNYMQNLLLARRTKPGRVDRFWMRLFWGSGR